MQHATIVLSWHEHLTEKERPPKWMWTIPDELEFHFEWVKRERDSGLETDDDDDDAGVVLHNEHARGRGRNAR